MFINDKIIVLFNCFIIILYKSLKKYLICKVVLNILDSISALYSRN